MSGRRNNSLRQGVRASGAGIDEDGEHRGADAGGAVAPVYHGVSSSGTTAEASGATERRRAIRSIMADASLTDLERRMRIQRLMDGSSRSTVEGGGRATNNAPFTSLAAGLPSSLLPATSPRFATATAVGGGGGQHHSEVVACVHYERKCNVVAPCCGRVFGCRVCHDEMSPACGQMDRFAIKEIVCKECGTRQGSKTNACKSCGITFADYHCPKCNIWMALSKRPFHCDKCGICRVGGRSNFWHCDRCCMCIPAAAADTHQCMTGKYKNNCPVCREDMFSSRQSAQDLPCGHTIHTHCFRNLSAFDYRCPICKKTVLSGRNMDEVWRARARDIAAQPMPEDLARTVTIICNDCERRSEDRSWHFLGTQCPGCSSFNTLVESMRPGNVNGGNSGDDARTGT